MKILFPVVRVITGVFIGYLFIFGFMGKFDWFIGFNEARILIFSPENTYFTRAKFGIFVIYIIAAASVFFIIISREWTHNFFGFFLALFTYVVILAF